MLRNKFLSFLENQTTTNERLNDVFGRENYFGFKNYCGQLPNDDKAEMEKYKYYFMCENNSEHNYATEKIWEPILCECLCFYWGCPNLGEHIDERAFVRLPLDNFEQSLQIIKQAVAEDWWSQRIKVIQREKKRIMEELGFFPTLNRLLSKNTVYICGCVKNCAGYLPDVLDNIMSIGSLFSNYKIVIAYDNSTDGSYSYLTEIKKMYNNVEIIINHNSSPRGTENIASARNSILKYIRKQPIQPEYFIMMDMDDVCSLPIHVPVIEKYLNQPDAWDALSFNKKDYYDIWALSIAPYYYSCWHWNTNTNGEVVDKMREYVINKLSKIGEDELVECHSAFNGFAIYKTAKFINCEYKWNINDNFKFITLDMMRENETALTLKYINTSLKPEDCEHRYFHMQAREENNAKIMISPLCLFGEKHIK